MKGIVLAGGTGSRLYPVTLGISKHMIPVFDKPMIYYPISILMELGIRDILIIVSQRDEENYKKMLGDGLSWGINLQYRTQSFPRGISEAFLIGEDFIGGDSVAMILGDNIFVNALRGVNVEKMIYRAETLGKATVFGYKTENPGDFGVVEFDERKNPISLEEKPEAPKSNYCVTGLYIYDNKAVKYAKNLSPSARGELEITDLNRIYLEKGNLCLELLEDDAFWTDAGTCDGLLAAANFVSKYEKETGHQAACPEEIAYNKCWIGKEELNCAFEKMSSTDYGRYLGKLIDYSQK